MWGNLLLKAALSKWRLECSRSLAFFQCESFNVVGHFLKKCEFQIIVNLLGGLRECKEGTMLDDSVFVMTSQTAVHSSVTWICNVFETR